MPLNVHHTRLVPLVSIAFTLYGADAGEDVVNLREELEPVLDAEEVEVGEVVGGGVVGQEYGADIMRLPMHDIIHNIAPILHAWASRCNVKVGMRNPWAALASVNKTWRDMVVEEVRGMGPLGRVVHDLTCMVCHDRVCHGTSYAATLSCCGHIMCTTCVVQMPMFGDDAGTYIKCPSACGARAFQLICVVEQCPW